MERRSPTKAFVAIIIALGPCPLGSWRAMPEARIVIGEPTRE